MGVGVGTVEAGQWWALTVAALFAWVVTSPFFLAFFCRRGDGRGQRVEVEVGVEGGG